MKNEALANRYAQALFAAAEEHQLTERIAQDLDLVVSEAMDTRGFTDFLRDRSVPAPSKKQLMRDVFGDVLHCYTLNFFYILFDKDREQLIDEIVSCYRALVRAKKGIVSAELITAVPCSDDQVAQLSASLKNAYGHDVVFDRRVDPSLLGGASVRMGDVVIDGSLRQQLDMLRHELTK